MFNPYQSSVLLYINRDNLGKIIHQHNYGFVCIMFFDNRELQMTRWSLSPYHLISKCPIDCIKWHSISTYYLIIKGPIYWLFYFIVITYKLNIYIECFCVTNTLITSFWWPQIWNLWSMLLYPIKHCTRYEDIGYISYQCGKVMLWSISFSDGKTLNTYLLHHSRFIKRINNI